MKRLCTRSLVRVTFLAALLSLGCVAASLADPDPTGGGFQGVPDEIQTRLPPTSTDDGTMKKHNVSAPSTSKKGGPILSTNASRTMGVVNIVIRTWQNQIRFLIQH